MTSPKTHLNLVVREGHAVRILVVECDTDDRPSSPRLRNAATFAADQEREPESPEFRALKYWRTHVRSA